jgi:hypothetical protein
MIGPLQIIGDDTAATCEDGKCDVPGAAVHDVALREG